MSLLLMFFWCLIGTLADVWLKIAHGFHSRWFVLGVCGYTLCGPLAVLIYQRQQFGWVTITWSCLSLGLGLAISMWVFHEAFTLRRGIASLLMLGAILVLGTEP